MKLVKSEVGQRVLKDRSVPLTPRQRSAFILFDGRNTVDQVLAATSSFGVTRDDIDHMVQLGLLDEVAGSAAAPPEAASSPAQPGIPPTPAAGAPLSDRTPQERFQAAYPVATKLTSKLGLMGFRLNLAVEQAMNYQQLCELAPRIKDAVPPGDYLELHRALYG